MDHPQGLGPDLDVCVDLARDTLAALHGQRILASGGTGFVGTWMAELLTWSADRLSTAPRLVLLSRDPARFARRHPNLAAHRCIELVAGDVRFPPSLTGSVDLLVAGASASIAAGEAPDEAAMRQVAAANALFARDLAEHHRCRVLFLSSGAAGRATPDAYGEAKLAAEAVLGDARLARPAVLARLFTFVGPFLPLRLHFAVGNFLADALAGRTIAVAGDGQAVRSYLYAADLARYLWVLAMAGTPGARYDVGAPTPVTIAQLAAAVARLVDPPLPVHVAHRSVASSAGSVYVPDCTPTAELGLVPAWDLAAALTTTLAWHRAGATSTPPKAPT